MLIDSKGNKVGLLSFEEALKSAIDASLDLVQVYQRFKSSCLQAARLWKAFIFKEKEYFYIKI